MTRDEALKKIQKCLALAASPEQHEAAAALRQAQKLMEQFGLSECDVSLADVHEHKQKAPSAPLVRWESALASLVAEAFGCEFFTTTGKVLVQHLFAYRNTRDFVFVGLGVAPEIAGYAFDVLSRQCSKDRRSYIGRQSKNCKPKTKVARGDLYAEGWVSGVRGKLQAFAGTPSNEALIRQYMSTKYSEMSDEKTKDRTTGKNVTPTDFGHGYQAGRAADIHHGLDTPIHQAKLGAPKP
nr:DUF2786 domain-containing protein [uncultured Comamonas sp.]